jgi:hypothetical protein
MLTNSSVLPFLTSSRSFDHIEAGVGETDNSFLFGLICSSFALKIYLEITLDTASLLNLLNCCFASLRSTPEFHSFAIPDLCYPLPLQHSPCRYDKYIPPRLFFTLLCTCLKHHHF